VEFLIKGSSFAVEHDKALCDTVFIVIKPSFALDEDHSRKNVSHFCAEIRDSRVLRRTAMAMRSGGDYCDMRWHGAHSNGGECLT
jgi:hypothetical protein